MFKWYTYKTQPKVDEITLNDGDDRPKNVELLNQMQSVEKRREEFKPVVNRK